jgi:hypothetical protein
MVNLCAGHSNVHGILLHWTVDDQIIFVLMADIQANITRESSGVTEKIINTFKSARRYLDGNESTF